MIIPCESLTVGNMPLPDGTQLVTVMLSNAAATASMHLTAELADKVIRDLTSALARARGLLAPAAPAGGLHLPGQ